MTDKATTDLKLDVIASEVSKAFAEQLEAHYAKMQEANEARSAKEVERTHTKGYGDWAQMYADKTKTAAGKVHPLNRKKTDERDVSFAKFCRYNWAAKGNPMLAAEMAFASGDEHIAKAIGENVFADGGAVVPTEFASGVIEELGAASTVLSPGQVTTTGLNGVLVLPAFNGSATASWVGENTNASSSNPTFRQVTLRDHILSVIVPVSNTWLMNSGGDRMIQDHMIRIAQRKLDVTLLRSLGVSNEPIGMLGTTQSANKFNANATLNVANVTADGAKAIRLLLDGDVPVGNGDTFWRFAPRTWQAMYQQRDSSGSGYAFRTELDNGMFLGYPYRITSQIPTNLGGGTDESEIYLSWDPGFVFAMNEGIQVKVIDGAAYHDGSNVIAALSQHQSVFQLIMVADFADQYIGVSSVVVQAVKWAS